MRPGLLEIGAAAALTIAALAETSSWRINTTASVPRGVWRVEAAQPGRGDVALICPPPAAAALAKARSYVGAGECPGDTEALLKPIAAVAGDLVRVSARGIEVNGRLLVNSAPAAVDTQGRPMMPVRPGEYRVPAGSVWVVSQHSPLSFDSRYFGPIPAQGVLGRARPILVESIDG